MPRNEIITALDIGTTKVCALVGQLSDQGEMIVIGVGIEPSTGMKKGVVVDIEATAKAIGDAVGKASRQAGTDVDAVYTGVTGEHISSLNSTGRIAITNPDREITFADVERVLEASKVIVLPPDRQILHAIPRTYSIDGQDGIHQPAGMSGTRLEVETHIVHAASTFLQNVEKSVIRAGLHIAEMVLEPIATAEAVLLPSERMLGVCLLDIGGGTSDMAVFSNGSIIYSCVIPIGGNHVTHDLAYGLAISHEEAERLKTESGSSVEDMVPEDDFVIVQQVGRDDERKLRRRALAAIIEPRMQEIFEIVQQELELSNCTDIIPAGIVISGGGSQIVGCCEIAQRILGISARVGRPHVSGGLGDTLTNPSYATAVGLLQHGSEHYLTNKSRRVYRGGGLLKWIKDLIGKFSSSR